MSLLTSAPTIVQKKIYSLAAGNFRTLRGMKSMTGYGRGECARDGFKITVELGAVNRRQSEISVNLPRELEMLEAQVRDAINVQVAGARAHQPAARQILRHRTGAAGEVAENFRRSFAGPDFARAGRFSER